MKVVSSRPREIEANLASTSGRPRRKIVGRFRHLLLFLDRDQAIDGVIKSYTRKDKVNKTSTQMIVEKVLGTWTPHFDHIVVAIEESKNLVTLKVKELQGSLEAHEHRLNERNNKKETKQALQAQISRRSDGRSRKNKREKRKWKNKWWNSRVEQVWGKEWRSQHEHFVNECRYKGEQNKEKEAQLAYDEYSNVDHVLLIVTTKSKGESSNNWYLDTCCSNLMSRRKVWFVNLNENLRQLVKKGYSISMQRHHMKVYDADGKLILKIEIQFLEQKCLVATLNDVHWLWQYKFKRLNFRSLDQLQNKVQGLPYMMQPQHLCEKVTRECIQIQNY
ncbi:hypothetical protein CR513_49947, partial [Mucuna pruriens]